MFRLLPQAPHLSAFVFLAYLVGCGGAASDSPAGSSASARPPDSAPSREQVSVEQVRTLLAQEVDRETRLRRRGYERLDTETRLLAQKIEGLERENSALRNRLKRLESARSTLREEISLLPYRKVVDRLSAADPDKRLEAVGAVANYDPLPSVLVAHLAQRLEDVDSRVRSKAADALGSAGSVAAPAAPALARVLAEDEDPGARSHAARALGEVAAGSRAAVSALVRALEDPERRVRRSAGETLGGMGPAARDAVPALQRRVGDVKWTFSLLGADATPDYAMLAIRRIRGR